MRVSILIPTLNRRQYLAEALESARRQTRPVDEILISDDGSTDGTPAYVSEVTALDRRVRLLPRNPSPGIFSNFNHLIRHSTGDAFAILGDDDRLAPTFVETLCRPMEHDPDVVASFCDHQIINADGTIAIDASLQNSRIFGRTALEPGIVADPLTVALRQSICIGFSLFRASRLKEVLFDVRCGGAADVDYVLRVASAGKLFFAASALGDYRQHPATATRTKAREMVEGKIYALAKHRFASTHEDVRRRLLRGALLSHALMTSAIDRRASLGSVRQFVQLGGSAFTPSLLLSLLLVASPRPVARRLEAALRGMMRLATDRSTPSDA